MLSKPTIKYIQSLQHKKFRDEYNCFVAEGPKVVRELLLSSAFNCKAIYALKEWADNIDAETKNAASLKLEIIDEIALSRIAAYTTPNQVVAVFEKKAAKPEFEVKQHITLVLDGIQDPGDLGTIIRTADWFGIQNIVCAAHTADMYNSKVVQSTMASLGRVNLIYTDIAKWLKDHQSVTILATTLEGKPVHSLEKLREAIVIIGNEANGISDNVLKLSNEKITIQGYGQAESLNAAVATGIILFSLKEICKI